MAWVSITGAKVISRCTVFCYGDHFDHQAAETNLKLFSDNLNARKRTEKDVHKAFTDSAVARAAMKYQIISLSC